MAGLNETPKGDRVHIAFFGLRNAGKSTLVNKLTGQDERRTEQLDRAVQALEELIDRLTAEISQAEALEKVRAGLSAARAALSVKLPEAKPEPVSPVLEYLAKEREALRVTREVSKAENNVIWKAQIAALTAAGLAPDKPLTAFTMDEAKALIEAMYANFTPTGTVLKDESKPS